MIDASVSPVGNANLSMGNIKNQEKEGSSANRAVSRNTIDTLRADISTNSLLARLKDILGFEGKIF